jgi:hypothetical protein
MALHAKWNPPNANGEAGRNARAAAQTEPRNAHQLRQRERGKHPQRHRAAGQGVEEMFLSRVAKAAFRD